jgi:hypothetical protein
MPSTQVLALSPSHAASAELQAIPSKISPTVSSSHAEMLKQSEASADNIRNLLRMISISKSFKGFQKKMKQ